MTEKEAIEKLRLESGLEIKGKPVRVAEFLDGLDAAISALEEIQQYRSFEKRLKKIYGDCPGLLEIVVKHLEAHDGIDITEPVFKARLLTDGEVDKWEAYNQFGTVEELREAMEKQRA